MFSLLVCQNIKVLLEAGLDLSTRFYGLGVATHSKVWPILGYHGALNTQHNFVCVYRISALAGIIREPN